MLNHRTTELLLIPDILARLSCLQVSPSPQIITDMAEGGKTLREGRQMGDEGSERTARSSDEVLAEYNVASLYSTSLSRVFALI